MPEKSDWSCVIKSYIDSLKESDKKDVYVDELVSIYLSKKLRNSKSRKDDDQAELSKLKNKISKTKATAAQRS